ncbi:hypothetical protein FA95DRAFT_117092 [Auriscalpium vulgare]|uniref:Uncharacterized protein n=1 Tax=Auriscalpium vulgare TaxID=40419 RepID=A0ACB8R1F7_9AGAM|nr:hypothetical protein FA95DRAFT_117092 [Auriscalpium vulgare]
MLSCCPCRLLIAVTGRLMELFMKGFAHIAGVLVSGILGCSQDVRLTFRLSCAVRSNLVCASKLNTRMTMLGRTGQERLPASGISGEFEELLTELGQSTVIVGQGGCTASNSATRKSLKAFVTRLWAFCALLKISPSRVQFRGWGGDE